MSQAFPNANKTFTLLRRLPGSTSTTTISTGLAVYIEVKNGYITTGRDGQVLTSLFDGICSKNAGIMVGDVLQDEVETNLNGEFITYEVQTCLTDLLFTDMVLHRTDIE